jgi:hypothetical protein
VPARYHLFSASLSQYRPVLWHALPVYSRYDQLRDLLLQRFDTDVAELLSEPRIPDRAEAAWFSDAFNRGTPLPALPPDEQARVSRLLGERLTAVRQLADELAVAPDAEVRQLADLLRLAVEVPSADCVLAEGNHVVLVLWGFNSDRSQQERFRISAYAQGLSTPEPVRVPDPPTPAPVPPTSQPPVAPVPPTTAVPPTTITRVRWYRRWWRWPLAALLLLLLIGLFWWLWPGGRSRPGGLIGVGSAPLPVRSPYLPPQAGIVPSIDTTELIRDPGDSLGRRVVGNRLNVFLKREARLIPFVEKLKKQYPGPELEVVAYDTLYKALQLQFSPSERETWRKRLEQFPEVYLVFDERLFQTQALPNDPDLRDRQKTWYFAAIQAFEAWNQTRGSEQITVAVLDGGFDVAHPELGGRVDQPRNVIDGNGAVNTASAAGGRHGTHVASTVAGNADNGQGAAGIAPRCRVMTVQVGGEQVSLLAVVFGMQYAIQHGAHVINLSLGQGIAPEVVRDLQQRSEAEQVEIAEALRRTPQYQHERQVFEHLFGEATRSGIVVVKAVGNDGLPAAFDPMNATPYTINVAAAQPLASGSLTRAPFSNYGPLTTVSAPGVGIYNAVAGGGYARLDGTSMAAPIVAGGVALLRSVRPDLRPDQLRDALVKTGRTYQATGKRVGPLIQLDAALTACRALPRDACAVTVDSLRRELQALRNRPMP